MKTAVDWLVHQLSLEPNGWMKDLIQQAKEMEGEQIKDAFVECWKENMPDGYECKLSAEEYYNETFKSE